MYAKNRKKSSSKSKRTTEDKIKDIVKKEIHKNTEDKQAFLHYPLTGHNSGVDSFGDAVQVLPNIGKSVNENGRIGNQIKAKNITVRGHFILTTIGNETTSTFKHNIVVRLMCVKVKNYPEVSSAKTNYSSWMPSLLRKGGTTSGFTGTIEDLYAPINTDAVTVCYDKKFRISQGYYNTANNQYPPSMDTCKMFKFKLKNSKILKYDDYVNSGLTPVNDAGYVMLCGYCFLDGTSPDTISTSIDLSFNTVFNYEDA